MIGDASSNPDQPHAGSIELVGYALDRLSVRTGLPC